MTSLLATLLLAASSQLHIGAQVVRSTSFSVERAAQRGNNAVQVAGVGYSTAGTAVVEASPDVKVRFIGNDVFETRGSGVVRVTLYADGAPPSNQSAAPSKVGQRVQVEVLHDVRALPAADLQVVADAR